MPRDRNDDAAPISFTVVTGCSDRRRRRKSSPIAAAAAAVVVVVVAVVIAAAVSIKPDLIMNGFTVNGTAGGIEARQNAHSRAPVGRLAERS